MACKRRATLKLGVEAVSSFDVLCGAIGFMVLWACVAGFVIGTIVSICCAHDRCRQLEKALNSQCNDDDDNDGEPNELLPVDPATFTTNPTPTISFVPFHDDDPGSAGAGAKVNPVGPGGSSSFAATFTTNRNGGVLVLPKGNDWAYSSHPEASMFPWGY